MKPSLVLSDSQESSVVGKNWTFQCPCVIGRRNADITIAIAAVSRRHAEITEQHGVYYLRDLGSRNGTALNGELLEDQPAALGDRDLIVLGGVVSLVFHDPDATPFFPKIGRFRGVWIDPNNDVVYVNAQRLEPPLSSRQFALLKVLHDADGAVVPRQKLVETVWADVAIEGVSDQAMDALMSRLRKRLADLDPDGSPLEVIKGRGARLRPSADTGAG